jgi:hypothetical protein
MDITANALKNMKSKQLRKIIREAIEEVLAEGTAYQIVGSQGTSVQQLSPEQAKAIQGSSNVKSIKPLEEDEIDEMARLAKGFKLADPNIDAAQFTKKISGVALSDIINFFRENPGTEKGQIQSQFGFVRPQIANAVVNGLLDAGVLIKLSASGEEEAPVAPGEQAPTRATEPEDLFIGGSDPLSMYFDNIPNDDDSEDFNAAEEPTTGEEEPAVSDEEPPASEIEPAEPVVGTDGMSDEDFAAWDKYDTLKTRLNGVKSDLNRMKRSKGKGGVAGDIGDNGGTEEQRLRDLKKSLEDRINSVISSSDYLKKKLEKETSKMAPEPVETTPEEEEEETIDETFDMAYQKRKLQFYAGIIK